MNSLAPQGFYSKATKIPAPIRLPGLSKARRKFLSIFRGGFQDKTYLAWERAYKAEAHAEWQTQLGNSQFKSLLHQKAYSEIAARAVKIESTRSLLFSFEKMALRDAVRSPKAAQTFSTGLYDLLHGSDPLKERFTNWCATVGHLPRKQTRVLTWPVVTVFGFIAQPEAHIFLKPNTTKEAARVLGYEFQYKSTPHWETYASYLVLATALKCALRDMRPRDMIDIQSFLWVLGSDEYR